MSQERDIEVLTSRIIACAIEVHRTLGPGLLESVYEECLEQELQEAGLATRRQVELPVVYKGRRLNGVFRVDLLVEGLVIVEVKAIEAVLGVHKAQVLTYLRLTGLQAGLLLNFHVPLMRDGISRLSISHPSTPPRLL
jgi:GxxExxY protein